MWRCMLFSVKKKQISLSFRGGQEIKENLVGFFAYQIKVKKKKIGIFLLFIKMHVSQNFNPPHPKMSVLDKKINK